MRGHKQGVNDRNGRYFVASLHGEIPHEEGDELSDRGLRERVRGLWPKRACHPLGRLDGAELARRLSGFEQREELG
jgi:hypothetical protein